jgi:hypothetical protein
MFIYKIVPDAMDAQAHKTKIVRKPVQSVKQNSVG